MSRVEQCGTCEFWSYGPQNAMNLPESTGVCRLGEIVPQPERKVQTISLLVTSIDFRCDEWELD